MISYFNLTFKVFLHVTNINGSKYLTLSKTQPLKEISQQRYKENLMKNVNLKLDSKYSNG